MKQFVYLDVNSINSIIAQADKGLVVEMSNAKENTDTSHSTKSTQVSAEGSISGGLSKLLKAQGTLSATLHDAAFDIAYMQLSSIIRVGNATDIGSYVELARPFQFIDFSYFERLFSSGGLIDFIKKTGKEEIEREAQSKIDEALSEDKTRSKDEKRKVELALKQEVKKMLLSQDGYLIPLEESCFRDNPQTMGFKYGQNRKEVPDDL